MGSKVQRFYSASLNDKQRPFGQQGLYDIGHVPPKCCYSFENWDEGEMLMSLRKHVALTRVSAGGHWLWVIYVA